MNADRSGLSPAMIRALEVTGLDDMMAGGPTRAALMRRGLVSKRGGTGRFGHFTKDGRKLAAEIQAERNSRVEPESETTEGAEMGNYVRYGRAEIQHVMSEIEDLDAVNRAVGREREIRIGMARTGEGREVVAQFLDAESAMNEEAVLDLTDGQPTTLVDALTRYLTELEGRDELQPRARVAGELAAILAFPWPDDERRVQLHDPHGGLALHITNPEKDRTEIRMGSNRWLVADVRHEGYGMEGTVREVAEAVYRATLARIIPDREHIVTLNAAETTQLRRWLNGEPGSNWIGDRLTVEASGGGVWIRTRPYSHQSIPRNRD